METKFTSLLWGGREQTSRERKMRAGGGLRPKFAPHPASLASLAPSTSPQGGGENVAQILSIARTWLGTPYVHQASVKGAGCDCLGLLRGVFRELTGEEAESPPPYSPDWAEAACAETLYSALLRHLTEIELGELSPGDIALFRMSPRGPAKHCGIVAEKDGRLTFIHARQNKRVSEELFTAAWRKKLAFAFRI